MAMANDAMTVAYNGMGSGKAGIASDQVVAFSAFLGTLTPPGEYLTPEEVALWKSKLDAAIDKDDWEEAFYIMLVIICLMFTYGAT